MIVDQHRAVRDQACISSGEHMATPTRAEWQFLQRYRRCTRADQDLIFRALSGDAKAASTLAQRQ